MSENVFNQIENATNLNIEAIGKKEDISTLSKLYQGYNAVGENASHNMHAKEVNEVSQGYQTVRDVNAFLTSRTLDNATSAALVDSLVLQTKTTDFSAANDYYKNVTGRSLTNAAIASEQEMMQVIGGAVQANYGNVDFSLDGRTRHFGTFDSRNDIGASQGFWGGKEEGLKVFGPRGTASIVDMKTISLDGKNTYGAMNLADYMSANKAARANFENVARRNAQDLTGVLKRDNTYSKIFFNKAGQLKDINKIRAEIAALPKDQKELCDQFLTMLTVGKKAELSQNRADRHSFSNSRVSQKYREQYACDEVNQQINAVAHKVNSVYSAHINLLSLKERSAQTKLTKLERKETKLTEKGKLTDRKSKRLEKQKTKTEDKLKHRREKSDNTLRAKRQKRKNDKKSKRMQANKPSKWRPVGRLRYDVRHGRDALRNHHADKLLKRDKKTADLLKGDKRSTRIHGHIRNFFSKLRPSNLLQNLSLLFAKIKKWVILGIIALVIVIVAVSLLDAILQGARNMVFLQTSEEGDSWGEQAIYKIQDLVTAQVDEGTEYVEKEIKKTKNGFLTTKYNDAIVGANGANVNTLFFNQNGNQISPTDFYLTREIITAVNQGTNGKIKKEKNFLYCIERVYQATHTHTLTDYETIKNAEGETEILFCDWDNPDELDACPNREKLFHKPEIAQATGDAYATDYTSTNINKKYQDKITNRTAQEESVNDSKEAALTRRQIASIATNFARTCNGAKYNNVTQKGTVAPAYKNAVDSVSGGGKKYASCDRFVAAVLNSVTGSSLSCNSTYTKTIYSQLSADSNWTNLGTAATVTPEPGDVLIMPASDASVNYLDGHAMIYINGGQVAEANNQEHPTLGTPDGSADTLPRCSSAATYTSGPFAAQTYVFRYTKGSDVNAVTTSEDDELFLRECSNIRQTHGESPLITIVVDTEYGPFSYQFGNERVAFCSKTKSVTIGNMTQTYCADYECGGHEDVCRGHVTANVNFHTTTVPSTVDKQGDYILDTSGDLSFFYKAYVELTNKYPTLLLPKRQYLDMSIKHNLNSWNEAMQQDLESVYGISLFSSTTGVAHYASTPLTEAQLAQAKAQSKNPLGMAIVQFANAQVGCEYLYGSSQQNIEFVTAAGLQRALRLLREAGIELPSAAKQAEYRQEIVQGNVKCFDCTALVHQAIVSAGISHSYEASATMYNNHSMESIYSTKIEPGYIFVKQGHAMIFVGIIDGQNYFIEAAGCTTGVVVSQHSLSDLSSRNYKCFAPWNG